MSGEDIARTLLAIAGALGLREIVGAWLGRRKTDAEARLTDEQAETVLYKRLVDEIARLRELIRTLDDKLDEVRLRADECERREARQSARIRALEQASMLAAGNAAALNTHERTKDGA